MDILGIGPTEFIFIIVILLLVLGPTDLAKLGQKTGQLIRKIRRSETWLIVANLAKALRNLPEALADETGAEEIFSDLIRDNPPHRTGNLSMDGAVDHEPDLGTIKPPEEDAYAAWTTPVADESASSVETTENPQPTNPTEDQ